jgi:hypothetical protein
MEADGGSARSVSVSVLDAEIEEFQRHVKRKRRISQSTDDESDIASCAALIFLIFSFLGTCFLLVPPTCSIVQERKNLIFIGEGAF